MSEHKNNVVLGAGEVYVDVGATGKERYIGDTPTATLSLEATDLDVFASDGPDTSKRLARVRTQVARRMTVELRDMSLDNIALFVGGNVATVDAISDKTEMRIAAPKKGDIVQILNAGRPVRGVKDGWKIYPGTTSGGKGSALTSTALKKFKLDQVAGRLAVIEDVGSTYDTYGIVVEYQANANQVIETDTQVIEGAVRYLETPVHGHGHNIYFPDATITASGDWTLKSRDQEQRCSLIIESLGNIVIDSNDVAGAKDLPPSMV